MKSLRWFATVMATAVVGILIAKRLPVVKDLL